MGLIIPGVDAQSGPTIDAKLIRFWKYLTEEYIDIDVDKMSSSELNAKHKFPIPIYLSLGITQSNAVDVTEVPGWEDLGLRMHFMTTGSSQSYVIAVTVVNAIKPAAKQLIRAVSRIDTRRTELKQIITKRKALMRKINDQIVAQSDEMKTLGIAMVMMPDAVGEEELEPGAQIPKAQTDERTTPLFRPTRAIRIVYNVRDSTGQK